MILTRYSPIIAALLLTGCVSSNTLLTAGGAAVGGVAGNIVGKGDPLYTAAGAAVGGVVTGVALAMSEKGRRKEYNRGYDQGQSNAGKELYWAKQNPAPTSSKDTTRYRSYYLPGATTRDGINYVPHETELRVVE